MAGFRCCCLTLLHCIQVVNFLTCVRLFYLERLQACLIGAVSWKLSLLIVFHAFFAVVSCFAIATFFHLPAPEQPGWYEVLIYYIIKLRNDRLKRLSMIID